GVARLATPPWTWFLAAGSWIVTGTWGGGSGTEGDMVYRDWRRELVAGGLAVVRYDQRGVRCNEMTLPPYYEGSSERGVTRRHLHRSHCVSLSLATDRSLGVSGEPFG